MALRFLLAVAEAGFAPGVTFYLSFFYDRRQVGFRQGCVQLPRARGGKRDRALTRPLDAGSTSAPRPSRPATPALSPTASRR